MGKKLMEHSYWDARKWGKRGREMAPATLSILIQRARRGDKITYGDLAAELEKTFGFPQTFRKTFYGSPAGLVGYVLIDLGEEWKRRLPPLNCIVINKQTKAPGKGADPLLREYAKKIKKPLNKASRPDLVERAQQEAFAYGDRWIDVAEALGAKILKLPKRKALPLPNPAKFPKSGAKESDQHKALKEWVRDNPKEFRAYGVFKKGKNEKRISSGDFPDVYFKNKERCLAVEVKASNAPPEEHQRGVFQVVKYREVLRAEQLIKAKNPNAEAILVTTTDLGSMAKAYAEILNVTHIKVRKSAEKSTKG